MKLARTMVVAALGAIALASSALADRAAAVTPLGVPTSSEIKTAGDFATIGFLVTQGNGRKLNISVKRNGKASKIVPDVKLIGPDGATLDLVANGGKISKPGATTWTGTLPNVPKTGLWRIEVRGGAGSVGAFTALIKAGDTLKTASSKISPPIVPSAGKADVPIVVGENMALTVTAKRAAGSNVLLQMAVLDRNGNAVVAPIAGNPKTGGVTLKGLRLPTFGSYTLRFTGNGTGGAFSYAISTAAAKTKGALPVAVAAPTGAEPLLSTSLDGSGSRSGAGGVLAYRWIQVSDGGLSSGVAITDADKATATFKAPATSISLAFQLSVAEGTTFSRPVTVAVEVGKRPVADAGRSQSVAAAAAVTLDGSASFDRRGAGLKFSWRQVAGDPAPVTLTGATSASPTFTAPNTAGAYHFALTVDDGRLTSDEDVVVVEVGDATKPVADAGREQYVSRMATVYLSGLASIAPSGVLDGTVAWTKVSGPNITLASADKLWPSFTAPKFAADFVFKFVVGGNDAGADFVAVHVREDETNLPANARGNGPLNVGPGPQALRTDSPTNNTVDPNNDALAIRWAQISGPPLALTNVASKQATATMVADASEHRFCAQANDGLAYGAPDIVVVRPIGFNAAPIANAGADQSAVPGAAALLDGRGSTRTDGGSGPLTYQWTQVSGADWYDFTTSPTFDPAVARPSVAIPSDLSSLTPTRSVLFSLVVGDGTNFSVADLVSVTYTGLLQNGLPVVTAVASDATPIAGEIVTLQGSAFDRDGDPMTFRWTQRQGPAVVLNPGPTALSPTFVAPVTSTPLKFDCVANDGISDGPTSPAITVTVDQPPTANITVTPVSGPPGTVVTMDGAAATNPSSDPEGKTITYQWRQISGPSIGLSAAQLTNSSISFTAPSGVLVFGLKVSDPRQTSVEKTASFSANLPPSVSPSATNIDTSVNTLPSGTLPTGVAGFAAYGATVNLSANSSGGTGTLSYSWRVVSQTPSTMSTISIASSTSPTPSFIVPVPTTAGPFGQTPQAVIGVTATDSLSQTSGEQTITIRFFASFAGNGTVSTTTNSVYTVISSQCVSCHSSGASCPIGGAGSGYNMSSPAAFLAASRGVAACASTGSTRLPAQFSMGQTTSASAYLLGRLKNNPGPVMPQGGALSTSLINLIQDWIDQGVRNN